MSTPATPTGLRALTPTQIKAFAAAWIGYLLDGFDFVMITLVLTEVAEEFQLSKATAATLISAAFISRWFGGLALGALGDRFGRKNAMVASIVTFSIGSLLAAISLNYVMLFVARLIIGLGMAGEYSASSTYVLESWPARIRNKASGFLISGYAIGAALCSVVYWLVDPWGWRALFWIGLLPIGVALVLRRTLPEPPEWQHAHTHLTGERALDMFRVLFVHKNRALNIVLACVAFAALLVIFGGAAKHWAVTTVLGLVVAGIFFHFQAQFMEERWPTIALVIVTVFCAFLYSWPIQSLLPTFLKEDLGLDPSGVKNMMVFAGLGAAAGAILAGFVGDWIGTRWAYVVSLLVSLPLIAPVFAFHEGGLWVIGVLLFLQQVFAQGISGLLPKWIGGHFRTHERAAGLGFSYNVGALGGAVAPVLGASLASTMPLGTAIASISVVLTVVVVLLIGFDAPTRAQRWLSRTPPLGDTMAEGGRVD